MSANDRRQLPSSESWEPPAHGELWSLIHLIRRRWWLILMCGMLAGGAAWWMQRGQLPQYTADILLQLRQGEEPVAGFNLVSSGGAQDFGAQLEILRSSAVLSSVVDSLDLRLVLPGQPNERSRLIEDVEFDEDVQPGSYTLMLEDGELVLRDPVTEEVISRQPPSEPVSGPGFRLHVADARAATEPIRISVRHRQDAIGSLRSRLLIEEGTGVGLIRVSYTGADPEHVARVVNTVGRSYQAHRAQTAREAAGRRASVISDQLVELADSLRDVQQEVLDYQERAGLLNPDVESNALLSAVLQTENQIRQMRFQESLLESVSAGLQAGEVNDANLQRIVGLGQELVPGGTGLYERLQNLQAERSRLTASRFGRTAADPEVEVVDSLIASTREDMRVTVSQSLELLRSRLASEEERLSELRSQVGELPARTAQLTRLQQRVDAVQEVFDLLVERYYEAQIQEGVETGNVEIVDAAAVPVRPDPSRRGLNTAIAVLAGLLVGGLGAAGIEQLDSSIRDPEDVAKVADLQVIGAIPRLSSGSGARALSESAWLGKEAFRGIRTYLRFAFSDPPRTLAVTSPGPAEGKSTVAVNLALTLVEQESKVLLVDADLRRPQLHRILGVQKKPGLTELLSGEAKLADCIRRSSSHGGLYVLPSGESVDSSAELLGGERFEELVHHLRNRFDTVMFDTPPLFVTDAAVIGSILEGTLIVARANETEKDDLLAAVETLRRVGAPIAGLVMNDMPVDRTRYSRYADYYAEDADRYRENGSDAGRVQDRPPVTQRS